MLRFELILRPSEKYEDNLKSFFISYRQTILFQITAKYWAVSVSHLMYIAGY